MAGSKIIGQSRYFVRVVGIFTLSSRSSWLAPVLVSPFFGARKVHESRARRSDNAEASAACFRKSIKRWLQSGSKRVLVHCAAGRVRRREPTLPNLRNCAAARRRDQVVTAKMQSLVNLLLRQATVMKRFMSGPSARITLPYYFELFASAKPICGVRCISRIK